MIPYHTWTGVLRLAFCLSRFLGKHFLPDFSPLFSPLFTRTNILLALCIVFPLGQMAEKPSHELLHLEIQQDPAAPFAMSEQLSDWDVHVLPCV